MGCQLIFVVEADDKSKSDWVYIRETIEQFYTYDRAHLKLSPIYMGGKGNYKKVEKEVRSLVKQYDSRESDNRSLVLYCFDCDDYDKNPADEIFLRNAKSFCGDRGYEYVWFCKDVERVYLGEKIAAKKKIKEAATFRRQKKIEKIEAVSLSADSDKYSENRSNLLTILDKCAPDLKRK